MSFIQFESRAGAPIQSGMTHLVPISRAMILRFPGSAGGIIWNRPVAVAVQMENGPEQVIPIQDITRQTQIILLTAALAGGLFTWMLSRFSKRRRSHKTAL